MRRIAVWLCAFLFVASPAQADSNGHTDNGHTGHTTDFPSKGTTKVTLENNTLVLTFGPIDLPAGHSGELASSLPIHFFKAPKDMVVTGYRSRIFQKMEGSFPASTSITFCCKILKRRACRVRESPRTLPVPVLRSLTQNSRPATACRSKKAASWSPSLRFYRKVPPTKDAIATFTMDLAPEGAEVKPVKVSHRRRQCGSATANSQTAFESNRRGHRAQGRLVQVDSKPLKFTVGQMVVKYAYPHGHDGLLLIALDDSDNE